MKVQLSIKALQQHIVDLCAAFNVELKIDPTIGVERARSISHHMPGVGRVYNMIHVPVVNSEETYACNLHELGHAVDPCGQLRTDVNLLDNIDMKLLEEEAAWRWARHYALVWTKGMEESKQRAYGSYVQLKRDGDSFEQFVRMVMETLARQEPTRRPYVPKTGTLDDFLKKVLK